MASLLIGSTEMIHMGASRTRSDKAAAESHIFHVMNDGSTKLREDPGGAKPDWHHQELPPGQMPGKIIVRYVRRHCTRVGVTEEALLFTT